MRLLDRVLLFLAFSVVLVALSSIALGGSMQRAPVFSISTAGGRAVFERNATATFTCAVAAAGTPIECVDSGTGFTEVATTDPGANWVYTTGTNDEFCYSGPDASYRAEFIGATTSVDAGQYHMMFGFNGTALDTQSVTSIGTTTAVGVGLTISAVQDMTDGDCFRIFADCESGATCDPSIPPSAGVVSLTQLSSTHGPIMGRYIVFDVGDGATYSATADDVKGKILTNASYTVQRTIDLPILSPGDHFTFCNTANLGAVINPDDTQAFLWSGFTVGQSILTDVIEGCLSVLGLDATTLKVNSEIPFINNG